jgi:putative flippase GtrA
LKHVAREVALYTIAMGTAFAVDLATLVALVEVAAVPYLGAAAVGFVSGGLVAYLLSVRFIFRHRRVQDRRIEAVTFIALGLVGLVVNLGGMWLGVEALSLHYVVAKVAAAGLSFVTNYGLRRLMLFTEFAGPAAGRQ